MSQQFVGEIRMFAGSFAPFGWSFCSGALLPISQYEVLYTLIGTTYGGDGVNTFALPDLLGRRPVHQGQGAGLTNQVAGAPGGVETVTVLSSQLPVHTHAVRAVSGSAGNATAPAGNLWAAWSDDQYDSSGVPNVVLAAGSVGNFGNGVPHTNISPFLAINFIIALQGIFPSQN